MAESSFLNPGKVLHAAKLTEGMSVADFGAGSGFFTRAAAQAVGPSGVVWALDAHQDMLPRIKNLALVDGLSNVEVMHADLEHHAGTALPPETFDLVIMSNILFGVEKIEPLIKETKRILKRHGRALVIDWKGSFGGLGPHPDHVVSKDHAQKLFEGNSFVFVDDVPAGAYHWGFIVRKKVQ